MTAIDTPGQHSAGPGQPSPLTRRRFLRDLGIAGGGAALLGAMETLGLAPDAAAHTAPYRAPTPGDFSLQGRGNATKVLVLGAGVAGLAAAYELEKAGYRVEVLEARDRPGGRSWTARAGTTETSLDGVTETCHFDRDQYMNMGPARIPQHHTTLEYCRELGVPIEVFANQNAQGWYYNEPAGAVQGGLTSTPVRHREAKADYFGYTSELLAKAVSQGALDADLTAADKDALIAFLRSFGALNNQNAYTGGSRRGYPRDGEPGGGFQNGTPNAPFDRSALLASRLGNNFSFEAGWDQAMLMFQPVGGMDAIPHALARALKGKITYEAPITRIENTGEGVAVTYANKGGQPKVATADYCICTIPPQVLKAIPTNFPAQVVADLGVPVGQATGKIGLQYGRRWWEQDEDLYGGITNTNMDVGTIWYPSTGYLGAKGVVVGYYNFGGNANAYGALSPAQRRERAVAQGRKVHGDSYATGIEASYSVDWLKVRYSEGGWVSWPGSTRGGPGTPYGRLLEPTENVYFAGDHLSHVIAWQHGAFESARKAVTDLHARVLAS